MILEKNVDVTLQRVYAEKMRERKSRPKTGPAAPGAIPTRCDIAAIFAERAAKVPHSKSLDALARLAMQHAISSH
jgi:hypothetical protein